MEKPWPGKFEPAGTEIEERGATVFIDNGVRYMNGDTPEKYLYMENAPEVMENRC